MMVVAGGGAWPLVQRTGDYYSAAVDRRMASLACALGGPPIAEQAQLQAASTTSGTSSSSRRYGGAKPLQHGRDAAHQGDGRRSVQQVRSADRYYSRSVPRSADPLPRWAEVAAGEKLQYQHALPSVGATLLVPPAQRGLHIARGTLSQHVAQPSGELDSGLLAERALPVLVATGAAPGPTLLLIAGEHGNEYESIAAVQTLLRGLDTATLSGRVVGVPVTSVDAFLAHQRISEDDGKNLARCWPGRPDGSISERVT
jgi:hypothetical protein